MEIVFDYAIILFWLAVAVERTVFLIRLIKKGSAWD